MQHYSAVIGERCCRVHYSGRDFENSRFIGCYIKSETYKRGVLQHDGTSCMATRESLRHASFVVVSAQYSSTSQSNKPANSQDASELVTDSRGI